MWDFFSKEGIKIKKDFINNAEFLLTSWMRLFKEAMYSPTKEVITKLDASIREFLNKFISKYLKLVGNLEEACEAFAPSEMKGTTSIYDLLAGMSIYCYDITMNLLHEKIEICMNAYRDELQKKSTLTKKLEDRLGWLIQLVAALLKAKTLTPSGFSSSDEKEVHIYAGIIKLMNYTTSLYQHKYFVSSSLEFAYLAFCEGFRNEVISHPKRVTCEDAEDFDSSSDTYTALEKSLGVSNFNEIIDMILHKMYFLAFDITRIINLQMHSTNGDLIQLTLEYMKHIIADSSRTKKLFQLPSILHLLRNHTV